ncbi:MAG: VCBS repeat-containing protein [Acidobacteria bacterium]|nr:VCBS repeat-containing protein [Acidobacteriota bacterium]
MKKLLYVLGMAAMVAVAHAASRPADIAFRTTMLDPGYGETVGVADLNKDGKLDIVAGESWYEGPRWVKHPLRQIDYSSGYIDNFSDQIMDVDGDGWPDVIQCSYFAHNIVWLKNPGKVDSAWKVTEIDNSGPTEFAFLVDLNNDGKAEELLPEFDRENVPAAWFELKDHKWMKHTVSHQSYGHGIGAGDLNGDGRTDILTPRGWLEAPADINGSAEWTFHANDWGAKPILPAGTRQDASVVPVNNGRISMSQLHLIDINGDGRRDIVAGMAHDYGFAWYEQNADGTWTQHIIDASWSQVHEVVPVDLNGDGQIDFVAGKRYFAHNGSDPGERDPVGIYWYEWRKLPGMQANVRNGGVEWIRHIVDYGGRMGAGVQTAVVDIDGDGDLDIISAGKSGLFLAENLTKSSKQPLP